MYHLSSLTIIYFILLVHLVSPTFLVEMSDNCRPPSHQPILFVLYFYPFLTKYILLAMRLVCLISLPFLAIHIAYLLSKTISGSYPGIMSGSLLNSSFINILNCAKSITAVHDVLYSVFAIDLSTSPVTRVPWSSFPL